MQYTTFYFWTKYQNTNEIKQDISIVKLIVCNLYKSVGGGGGTPYNGLYGEAPPERPVSLWHERVAISLVEVP